MKLSDLVNYKNQLEVLSTVKAQEFVNTELTKFTYLVNDPLLEQDLSELNVAFNKFNNTVSRIQQNLKLSIEEAEKPWFQESYELYDGELSSEAANIFAVRQPTSDEDASMFRARLSRYVDWHHAGLIIRPGKETFIQDMVGFDPLYLVDINHDFLAPAIENFAEQYQRRLRTYIIKEDSQEILTALPNNQFSICLAYNYFNFRPFEIIKQYLLEVYQKLKPGGIFIMTFNDCDKSSAVKLVENYYCCYTPGYLMRELAQSMGFEIEFYWDDYGPSTWMELKKPGSLSSLKGGQTLAKILPKQL